MRTLTDALSELEALRRPTLRLCGPRGVLEHKAAVEAWRAANPGAEEKYVALLSEVEAIEKATAQAQRQEALMRGHSQKARGCGLTQRMVDDVAKARPTQALRAAQEWLASEKTWFVMYGGVGTGKTTAAAWCVLRALESGQSALVLPSVSLARLSSFDDAGAIDRAREVALLVVDDLGREGTGGYPAQLLHEVLDWRHGNYLRTILTSNLGREEIASRYPALTDRVAQDGRGVALDGASLRRVPT